MNYNIRLPGELGRQLREHREALGMSKSELAEKAGKVREVVYRLEAGEDTTVSSLMAVLGRPRPSPTAGTRRPAFGQGSRPPVPGRRCFLKDSCPRGLYWRRAADGQLLKTSTDEFRYLDPDPEQPAVALLMSPKESVTWQDGDLFAPMDQNLPEGDLFMRIRELFPKQPMTPMHLLALVGRNGIGRLGYRLAELPVAAAPRPLSKAELLKTRYTPEVFNELVAAYLSTGAGIAGMQPKIMVPDLPTVPIPAHRESGQPRLPGLGCQRVPVSECRSRRRHRRAGSRLLR